MVKKEVIDISTDFWQPYYRQELTEEDAKEIIENSAAFFGILAEWERRAQEDDGLEKQELVDRDREVLTRGDLVRDSAFGG